MLKVTGTCIICDKPQWPIQIHFLVTLINIFLWSRVPSDWLKKMVKSNTAYIHVQGWASQFTYAVNQILKEYFSQAYFQLWSHRVWKSWIESFWGQGHWHASQAVGFLSIICQEGPFKMKLHLLRADITRKVKFISSHQGHGHFSKILRNSSLLSSSLLRDLIW